MTDQVGQQFGNYRLTRPLGSGGFAEVYLGEHVYLKTQAAIKVLQTYMKPNEFQDFLREAQTIAALKHPRIVRVLDFGVQGTVPFLVMDYAPLGTLRNRHPSGSLLHVSTIVPYVKQIAQALQYAHDHQLIHRDIKPENMLAEIANDLLLSDFGIAIIAHKTQSLSTQEAIGTVSYMAPEQIKGKARPASDQYSLGIVVYEWLCGVRPFVGATSIEVAMSHLTDPPPPLRMKVPTIPVEVEEVVLKALAKEPQQRFASVQAFAEALEQASRLANPTVRVASPPSQPPASALPPTVYVSPPPPAPTLPPAQRASVSPSPGTILCTCTGHSNTINAVTWSPDGTRLASGSNDKTVQIWDARTGQNLLTYTGHAAQVTRAAWSPDGTRIASGSNDKTVQIWDARTGQCLLTYTGHSRDIDAVTWSPDGTWLASAGRDNTVQVWDARTGQRLFTYPGHSRYISSVAWSPDGSCLAGVNDGKVVVWDARTGQNLLTYTAHDDPINAVAWSPDGTRLSSAGWGRGAGGVGMIGAVQVWDARTGQKLLMPAYDHFDTIISIAWSSDGSRLAGVNGGRVEVWDARTGKGLLSYSDYHAIAAVAWSPDSKRIASGGEDQTVQVWQAP